MENNPKHSPLSISLLLYSKEQYTHTIKKRIDIINVHIEYNDLGRQSMDSHAFFKRSKGGDGKNVYTFTNGQLKFIHHHFHGLQFGRKTTQSLYGKTIVNVKRNTK